MYARWVAELIGELPLKEFRSAVSIFADSWLHQAQPQHEHVDRRKLLGRDRKPMKPPVVLDE